MQPHRYNLESKRMCFDGMQIRFVAQHRLHLTVSSVGMLTQFANFHAKMS
jgi:hypothetical protein